MSKDELRNAGTADRQNGSGDLTKTAASQNMTADQIAAYQSGFGS